MKTWEMIRKLTEDPSKEFKNKKDGYKVKMIDGIFIYPWYNSEHELQTDDWFLITGNVLKMEWEEVKKPVTWQEAVQAWIDGKKIYCILGDETYEYTDTDVLSDAYEFGIGKDELELGKWFIE